MFFTTEDKVNVIQFGNGDIDVSAGLIDELDKTIGCLSLSPREPSEIGTVNERGECMLDTMCDVHTRLIFTDPKSIDVVIEYLQQAKECMRNG